jgi:hypothetical protein
MLFKIIVVVFLWLISDELVIIRKTLRDIAEWEWHFTRKKGGGQE